MATMTAARLREFGRPLALEEVPRPEVSDGEVLVRVEGAGFCHTDLHIIDGEFQVLPQLPLTLGHENAGTVAAVGRGVTSVKEGDPVVVYGGWGCGHCSPCVSGEEHLCRRPEYVGILEHGGYTEYLLVPRERYLIKLDRLDPREAAVYTDAALTPYRAIKKALPALAPDGHALVIGVGGLGQFGVKLLSLLSAIPIMAVDIDEAKLELARAYGAAHAFDGRDEKLAERILELTGGVGVQAAFDFVGTDETLALAIGAAATGSKVFQVGLAGGAADIRVLHNARFEVQFEVSFLGNVKELHEVIALVESGRLTPIDLEFAPLDAINDVYRRLKDGQIEGRAVITP